MACTLIHIFTFANTRKKLISNITENGKYVQLRLTRHTVFFYLTFSTDYLADSQERIVFKWLHVRA